MANIEGGAPRPQPGDADGAVAPAVITLHCGFLGPGVSSWDEGHTMDAFYDSSVMCTIHRL